MDLGFVGRTNPVSPSAQIYAVLLSAGIVVLILFGRKCIRLTAYGLGCIIASMGQRSRLLRVYLWLRTVRYCPASVAQFILLMYSGGSLPRLVMDRFKTHTLSLSQISQSHVKSVESLVKNAVENAYHVQRKNAELQKLLLLSVQVSSRALSLIPDRQHERDQNESPSLIDSENSE